jgi:hypothetical protein
VEDGKAEVVHDLVVVIIIVTVDLNTHREALHTQVKVSTCCALDADVVRDISLAVVAVVQGPAGNTRGWIGLCRLSCCYNKHLSAIGPTAAAWKGFKQAVLSPGGLLLSFAEHGL